MDHRQTLGLSSFAGADEIKQAYRKLAMQHHPDRGGTVADFQRIQHAYQELEKSGFAANAPPRPQARPRPNPAGWAKPESPGNTWRDKDIDSIFDEFKKANRAAGPKASASYGNRDYTKVQPDGEIVARVTMREAFSGFNIQVTRPRNGGVFEHVYVNVPPGTPNGYRGTYNLSDGSRQVITTMFDPGDFTIRGFADTSSLFTAGMEVGDIEIEMKVDAIDLITGAWITIKDFLGEELKVRIPAGFSPQQRLKVANKGYAGWSDEYKKPTEYRRDMYIRLTPVFNKPADIARDKILNLYNSVGGWENDTSNV